MTVDAMVAEVVDYIVDVGTMYTTSGNWHIGYDEISECFDYATREWLMEHHVGILDALDGRAEILSETWTDFDENGNPDGFDCNFCGTCCPSWE